MAARQRVLITGAAGFIGSHTVDHLLGGDCDVLGVDDFSTGRESNLESAFRNSAFQLVRADVSEPRRLAGIVASFQPQVLIHHAALVSVPRAEEDPALNYRLNIAATHEVCEAARRHAVPRIVFASSAAVYGACDALPIKETSPAAPVSQYGTAKRVSEQILAGYAASYGLENTSFRFFNVYGPRQDPNSPYSGVVSIFCDRYLRGEPVTLFGDGSQSRDFVFVGDLARIVSSVATSREATPGIFNCCTGCPTTLLELVATLDEIFPGIDRPTHAENRAGDIQHSLGDPSALEHALGFKPETPFSVGLRTLIESLSVSPAN